MSFIHYAFYALHAAKWCLSGVGVLIIVSGGVQAAWYMLTHWYDKGGATIDAIRCQLGLHIVLGLEFILASDVIMTIVLPDYYNLGILAILVAIRTVLNYFLGKEIEQLQEH